MSSARSLRGTPVICPASSGWDGGQGAAVHVRGIEWSGLMVLSQRLGGSHGLDKATETGRIGVKWSVWGRRSWARALGRPEQLGDLGVGSLEQCLSYSLAPTLHLQRLCSPQPGSTSHTSLILLHGNHIEMGRGRGLLKIVSVALCRAISTFHRLWAI